MNRQIITKIDRIKRTTKTICDCVGRNDPVNAMAHCAELGEIARRLREDFAQVVRIRGLGDIRTEPDSD